MKKNISVFIIYFLIVSLIGCDAFVRKFTRKPKREELPEQELVLAPEEYRSTMTKEEQYRQYFLFWESWQGELVQALLVKTNRKKPVSCINEAIKNLEEIQKMLDAEKQKKLESYLVQLKDLRETIIEDTYGTDFSSQRMAAERIKRAISRDFSYSKVKDSLL